MNLYKNKVNEIELERKRINLKIELYEKKINELSEEYSNDLKEKMNEYEKKEAELKNKHEIIIENDKEEIKKLKEELLKIQIEKDNIAEKNTSNEELLRNIESECNLEKNKIYQNYINAKNDLNLIEEKKTEEIQNLTMRNKNLENKNSELEKELEILRMNEKKRIKIMNDMQTNLYELQNELNRMNIEKRNNNDENNRIKNEKEKLIAVYESKIKKII